MEETPITEDEYRLSLNSLIERIEDYLENKEGNSNQLLKEAEELLELRESFPAIYDEHQEIEGLLASLMAQKKQDEFMHQKTSGDDKEAPGCLLGWLFGTK